MDDEFRTQIAPIDDWKERLYQSRRKGVGFAAPGGEFTKAFAIWLSSSSGSVFLRQLANQRLIELGAGMYHYGYLVSHQANALEYIGIEPYYADCLEGAIALYKESFAHSPQIFPRTKIVASDMLKALSQMEDNSANIIACGIEQCILPDYIYRAKVEREIARIVGRDSQFFSYQSDLTPHLSVVYDERIRSEKRKSLDQVLVYRNAPK